MTLERCFHVLIAGDHHLVMAMGYVVVMDASAKTHGVGSTAKNLNYHVLTTALEMVCVIRSPDPALAFLLSVAWSATRHSYHVHTCALAMALA